MLRTRILSAVVLIPVVLFLLFFSPETTALATAIGAVLGTYEFYDMARRSPLKFAPLMIPGYALAAFLSLAGYLKNVPLMLLAITIFALFALVGLWGRNRIQADFEHTILDNWGMTIFGPVYVGLPLALAAYIRTATAEPIWWIVLALVGTWGTDTGAYAIGRMFGKHPLAPKISPKKTVEGAIGGAITGIVGVSLVGVLALNLSIFVTVPLGLVLAIGGILGDLFESWVKRRFDTKDSGKIIPGHGGVLDRIDALLVVLTLTYLFILIRG